MNTVIYSNSGYQELTVDGMLRSKRMIYIEGEINDAMAVKVSKELSQLTKEDPTEPVKIFINSGGGSIDAGMVIYDIIQSAPMPIKTYCLGRAYSMAAVLFCCGGNGRYLLPHGHMHNDESYNLENRKNGILRYDVGVEANGYYPVSVEQIMEFFGIDV